MATERPEPTHAAGERPDAQARPGADAARSIDVEIAWVGGDGQVVRRSVRLSTPATVRDALAALEEAESEALLESIAQGRLQTAVYGEACDGLRPLFAHDRIELVARLAADPKIARRQRVQRRRETSPRDKWRSG